MEHWMTDSVSISGIPSQMHPSPIILWQVTSTFMLLVLSKGNKFKGNMTCVTSLFDSHIFIKYVPHLDFFNPN